MALRYIAVASLMVLGSGSLVGSGPAEAADLGPYTPPPQAATPDYVPALLWSGIYVGLNAGYSSSRESTHEFSAIPYDGTNLEHFRSSAGGFTGGGQIGYNYQTGPVVLGIETDFNYVNTSRSVTSPSGAVTANLSDAYMGTVRPRLGLGWGPWLFYGTGGLAYASVDTTITGNTANTLTATNNDIRVGWAAGGGIEYALNRKFSVRAEYLHSDLGSVNVSGVALDTNTYAWRDRLTNDMVRLGVNFRLF
jgi:outer membrane immunogenic protein